MDQWLEQNVTYGLIFVMYYSFSQRLQYINIMVRVFSKLQTYKTSAINLL